MIDAGPALKRILEVFEKLGIPCFAGGSLASSVHGIPRATRDIDLIAQLDNSQVDPLVAEIRNEFHADPERIKAHSLPAAHSISFTSPVGTSSTSSRWQRPPSS